MASLGRAAGDGKENVPPRLRRCPGGEQRNVQKNVNVDLFLNAGSRVDISHHCLEPAAFSVDHSQRAGQGRLCTAPLPAGKRNPRLIQTNLPCPSQTLRDTTSQLSNSCFQQQNNLCLRLQQRSFKDLSYRTPCLALSVLPAVDLPQRPSYLYADSLEGRGNESVCLPQHHHQKAKAGGCCSICSNGRFSERRNKNSEYPVEKQQRWSFAASCMAHGNSSHLLSHTVDPLLGNKSVEHLSLRRSRESVNSFCCASALSLGDLRPPSLAESFHNSVSFQSVLESSQTSASLHCSIQRLKQETVWMGIWGSLPLEPSSAPVNGSLCFAPDDSAPGILSTGEQLAGVSTHAAQARLKWGVPFAKDWSLSAVPRDFCCAEPASVSHRYGHTNSHTWRTKLSGNIQRETLSAAVCSGWLVDAGAGSSYNCSPCFRYQSQAKPVLETGGLYVHKKNHSSEKIFKREKNFDRAPPSVVSWKKGFPSSLYPGGLQVSLETQFEGAQMNVGVAMCGSPRQMCVRVASPSGDREFGSVQQLSIKSVEVSTSEPHGESSKESKELCDSKLHAARRMAVVDGSKSSPFSVQLETVFGEFSDVGSVNVSREGGRKEPSRQHSVRNWEPDTNVDQSEGLSVERSASKPQCCEEGSQMQETVRGEILESSFWSVKGSEQSFQNFCDRQALTRCFQAWKSHVFCKRAAARQLHRQQLLRKGLGALQWAVHLRRMQLEIAQRKHTSALLTVTFHRWKEALAKQSKKQTLQPEPYSLSVDFSGVGRLATMKTSTAAQHQFTVGCLKEAEQACRVEGELWTQLHRRQRGDEFCWRAQAIRDMRRLAAAFRLWRLQKELLSKEEARLEEAQALLKKKLLQSTFQMWRSRCLEIEKFLALTTQIQRNLIFRCFKAWKESVKQKARNRCNLAQHRAGLLRKYFQQWVWMLQVRKNNKQTIVSLFILRWRQYYGPTVSSVADQAATKTHEAQPWWTVTRWLPEKAGYSLNDLYQKVKLQRVFLLWKTRFCEHQRADSFSQALEQCRLREALRLWHQMFLTVKTIKQSPKHSAKAVHKDPLALLVSEDLSTSSGFHSSAPATCASQSSSEKEYSPSDSSRQSFSSILTAEDVTQMPYYSSLLQLHQCTELPAELGGELCLQTSFPPQSPGLGGSCLVGGQFQSLELHTLGSNVQPLASYSAWEEDCSLDKEVKCCSQQAEKRCLQRYFFIWSSQSQQLVKAQQYCRLTQLSRSFLGWHHWVMEAKNRKAAASVNHHIHCCQMVFNLWKKRLSQKVEADRRFRCHVHQRAADALWHWHSSWQKNRAMRELQQQWAQHSCQEKKRLVMRTWSCQIRKQRSAALFWERILLHRCLIAWSHVTAFRLRQREALSCFESAREHRLLAVSFAQWRLEFLRAEQQLLGEGSHEQQASCQAKACHRWRLASRGQKALRLGSVATMEQACNYWTKAAAFSQCLRQCSSLIGARKIRKMSLSWSMKKKGCRDKGSQAVPAAPLRLFPSAIHRWRMIYRNESKVERQPLHQLAERLGVLGSMPAHARIQENNYEVGSEEPEKKWLGRKYLRWWHHAVMLRHCQRGRRLRCLTRAWQQWKEASSVALLARELEKQRLMEKAWRTWRRHHLQICVVQSVLEEEARNLLSHAFERWRQLTTFQLESEGHC